MFVMRYNAFMETFIDKLYFCFSVFTPVVVAALFLWGGIKLVCKATANFSPYIRGSLRLAGSALIAVLAMILWITIFTETAAIQQIHRNKIRDRNNATPPITQLFLAPPNAPRTISGAASAATSP